MVKWKTVSVRQELLSEIEKALETGRYRSISEFVSEAIRLRLEETLRAGGVLVYKQSEILEPPAQFAYTPRHTWAKIMPDGNVLVGLSDYAQRHLKGITQIHVDPVGKKVNKMEPFGVAETWMLMLDLYSPVSGKIAKINHKLKLDPHLIKEYPYTEGWIIEIKPNNSPVLKQEFKNLLNAREYTELVNKLEEKLRE